MKSVVIERAWVLFFPFLLFGKPFGGKNEQEKEFCELDSTFFEERSYG
jgi:hypothetical protein